MDKPILFSTPMVQAILAGRKTVTRRTIKLPRIKGAVGFLVARRPGGPYLYPIAYDEHERHITEFPCPYDACELWVRETWGTVEGRTFYKADSSFGAEGLKYKPSIHMHKNKARLFLVPRGIKIEKLQDITEDQAIAEGVQEVTKDGTVFKYDCGIGTPWKDMPCSAVDAFKELWIHINGLDSWEENPFVWVIPFERRAF